MLATQYAEWYGIAPRGEDESDSAFKERVSGALRDQGHIIEAHEVHADACWDADGGTAFDGVMGAVAMALQNRNYGSTGYNLVGDEIAAGVIAQSEPKLKLSVAEIMIALELFGK